MTLVDAQTLSTRDCAVPGCPDEAHHGQVCDFHRANPIRGALPNRPGALAHLMNDDTPAAKRCKVDGCANPTAGKGGWCVGLCDHHISEEAKRRQAVRYAKTAPKANLAAVQTVKPPPEKGQPKAGNPKPVADKPAATPAPAAPAERTLVQLAQQVEDAQAAVTAAHAAHTLAVGALRDALDAAA